MNNNPILNDDVSSTAIVVDIRNSSIISRKLSLERLANFAILMQSIKEPIFTAVLKNNSRLAINDTGDGFAILIWGNKHAALAMRLVLSIEAKLELKRAEFEKIIKGTGIDFGFGIGVHSSRSIIIRSAELNRDFFYGPAINSAARIESFTKNFIGVNILFSDYYYTRLKRQSGATLSKLTSFTKIIVNDRIDIKDFKKKGHLLYTLKPGIAQELANILEINLK